MIEINSGTIVITEQEENSSINTIEETEMYLSLLNFVNVI